MEKNPSGHTFCVKFELFDCNWEKVIKSLLQNLDYRAGNSNTVAILKTYQQDKYSIIYLQLQSCLKHSSWAVHRSHYILLFTDFSDSIRCLSPHKSLKWEILKIVPYSLNLSAARKWRRLASMRTNFVSNSVSYVMN